MKDYYTALELADMRLPGLPGTKRNVNRLAVKQGWAGRERDGKGGGREYAVDSLPGRARGAILKMFGPLTLPSPTGGEVGLKGEPQDRPYEDYEAMRGALWREFDSRAESIKREAARRMEAVVFYETLLDDNEEHKMTKQAALAMAGEKFREAPGTIRRWAKMKAGFRQADWLAALAPRYGEAGRREAQIPAEAWDYFKADYLRAEAPAAAACYERLSRMAVQNNISLPHVKTFQRRIGKEIPYPVLVLCRRGPEALARVYPAQERDRSVYHALQAVNADGHRVDVFCVWPDGTIARPMVIVWQDIYSAKYLAFRAAMTENTETIRLAFGDVVERYGAPEEAYLDNGRGFASKWMTGGTPTRYRFKIKKEDPIGVMTSLGVKIRWVTPHHGQAKPIERSFKDFCEYVAKHPAFTGAYTGNNPNAKPENYQSRAIPIDEFLITLEQEIIYHNAKTGRRSAVCGGVRSFDQAFAESYEKSAIRKATAEQRRLWLMAAEGITASARDGSITLMGNRFWSKELSRMAGQACVVRFDPQHLQSRIYVYATSGKFICEAPCVMAAGFNDAEAAREHIKARKTFIKATKAVKEAEVRMTATQAAALLPAPAEEEEPETNVIAPIFGDWRRGEEEDGLDVDAALAESAKLLRLKAEGF